MQKPLQMLVCWHISNEVGPMGLLHQRHIIVAISGGIAAYKGAELVRLLKKQGAVVRSDTVTRRKGIYHAAHTASAVWRTDP